MLARLPVFALRAAQLLLGVAHAPPIAGVVGPYAPLDVLRVFALVGFGVLVLAGLPEAVVPSGHRNPVFVLLLLAARLAVLLRPLDA